MKILKKINEQIQKTKLDKIKDRSFHKYMNDLLFEKRKAKK